MRSPPVWCLPCQIWKAVTDELFWKQRKLPEDNLCQIWWRSDKVSTASLLDPQFPYLKSDTFWHSASVAVLCRSIACMWFNPVLSIQQYFIQTELHCTFISFINVEFYTKFGTQFNLPADIWQSNTCQLIDHRMADIDNCRIKDAIQHVLADWPLLCAAVLRKVSSWLTGSYFVPLSPLLKGGSGTGLWI